MLRPAAVKSTAGPVVQLALSDDAMRSLDALLTELVAAGLAAIHPAAGAGHHSAGTADHRVYQLSRSITALAGAMWARSTVGSGQMLSAGLTSASTSGSAAPAVSNTSTTSKATPAEQLAALLLLFACSWVLSGQCSSASASNSHMMMQVLHNTLLAVLAGAGYAWAAPPATLGLLGARPCLHTGRWVSWDEDLHTLGAADSAACSDIAGKQQQRNQPQGYHVCVAAGDEGEDDWGYGLCSAPDVSNTGARAAESLFLHTQQTCALQCVLYWAVEAGLSTVLLAAPGSGVRTTVRTLLLHTWADAPCSAAAATAAVQMQQAGEEQIQRAAGCRAVVGTKAGCAVLQVPAGLTASHAASMLCAYGLGQQSTAQGGASSHKCILFVPDALAASGSHAAWQHQLLKAAAGAAMLPLAGTSNAAGAVAGVGAQSCGWLLAPSTQLVLIAEPGCSTLGAHSSSTLLQLNTECFSAVRPPSKQQQQPAAQRNSSLSRMSPESAPPLADPSQVLAVLLKHWGVQLPYVPRVPRQLQLSGLHSIWLGLTAAITAMRGQGLLAQPVRFDMRHYQASLLQLVSLCQQVAEHSGSTARQQQQQAAGTTAGQTVPPTPCTPGFGLLLGQLGAPTPSSCSTPCGRMSLKSLCLFVVEVLSRVVADAAGTAEQQQGLQRLIVLLVVQHLSTLDQSDTDSSCDATPTMPVADAQLAASDSSTAGDSQQAPPHLLQQLAAVTSPCCDDGTAARQRQVAALWETLQHAPDVQLCDGVRQANLPAVLSGRYMAQLLAMAAFGRDLCMLEQPLHISIAQQELAQLLAQQRHHQALGSACTTSSSDSARSGMSCMPACALASAARLLSCSSWVAALHKLTWHLEASAAAARQPDATGPQADSSDSADQASSCAAQLPPLVPAAQSVVLLSGPSAACLFAVAATAAASTGCSVMKLGLGQLAAQEEGLLLGPAQRIAGHTDAGQPSHSGPTDTADTQQQQQDVVLLLDLTERRRELSNADTSVLQGWISRLPWAVPGGVTPPARHAPHLVLLCMPHQQQALQSSLGGSHCYQLCLPGEQTREQLQQDCRTQLIAGFSKDLTQHVQDVAALSKHNCRKPASSSSSAPQSSQQQVGEDRGQPEQQCGGATHAASAVTEARHLADTLAGAMAEAHSSAVAAYQVHYSSDTQHGNSSISSSQACYEAVPLSRPADVL